MNKKDGNFTHMDYRHAKIIHLVGKNEMDRYIYKKQEISKEDADAITSRYLEEKEKKRMKEDIQ